MIAKVQTQPVDPETLARAKVKARSRLYQYLETTYGFGRADLLAAFALFFDDPGRVNQLEDRLLEVTPELLQKTAQKYLRRENRTVLTITPKTGA